MLLDKNLSTTFVFATYDKLADESYRSRLYLSYKLLIKRLIKPFL